MDSSFRVQSKWVEAQKNKVNNIVQSSKSEYKGPSKWQCPQPGTIKVNMDVSVFQNSQTFNVGMVMRDVQGTFLMGRNVCLPMVESVFEAETVGVREALSWIKNQQILGVKVLVETDSLLTVHAIKGDKENCSEVGEVIEECKQALLSLPLVSICFIRKNANKVANEMARIPV